MTNGQLIETFIGAHLQPMKMKNGYVRHEDWTEQGLASMWNVFNLIDYPI